MPALGRERSLDKPAGGKRQPLILDKRLNKYLSQPLILDKPLNKCFFNTFAYPFLSNFMGFSYPAQVFAYPCLSGIFLIDFIYTITIS